jgi:hypothetical protein
MGIYGIVFLQLLFDQTEVFNIVKLVTAIIEDAKQNIFQKADKSYAFLHYQRSYQLRLLL